MNQIKSQCKLKRSAVSRFALKAVYKLLIDGNKQSNLIETKLGCKFIHPRLCFKHCIDHRFQTRAWGRGHVRKRSVCGVRVVIVRVKFNSFIFLTKQLFRSLDLLTKISAFVDVVLIYWRHCMNCMNWRRQKANPESWSLLMRRVCVWAFEDARRQYN